MDARNTGRSPLPCTPTWDRTCNLGTCPDWKLNLRPFGSLDNAPIELHRPGLCLDFHQAGLPGPVLGAEPTGSGGSMPRFPTSRESRCSTNTLKLNLRLSAYFPSLHPSLPVCGRTKRLCPRTQDCGGRPLSPRACCADVVSGISRI